MVRFRAALLERGLAPATIKGELARLVAGNLALPRSSLPLGRFRAKP
jgi:hypothetical protein